MITSNPQAIWFCIFALLVVQSAASGKKTTKMISEERRVRALRPSFVKRDSQAPLVHAPDEKIDDEYIVKLKDDLTDDQLVEFEEKFQALSEEHGLHIDFQLNVTRLMKGFVARVPGDAVDILRWLDEVDFVEEDGVMRATLGNWGIDRIDQLDLPLDDIFSSNPYGTGSGINVFIVDSGILFDHREFGGRAVLFEDYIHDKFDLGEDCTGHGSGVAGIVGGNTVGVAPGVTLHSVRIFGCEPEGDRADFLAAYDAIANSNMKPAVVSISAAGGHSEVENLAIKRLVEAGYTVVVGAANDENDACLKSPASAPEAITVGATDSDDSFAWYSNYGSCVDILAPGTDIRSAFWLPGSYFTTWGTSYATPFVSGVAALLLEADNTLTPTGVYNALMKAAASDRIDMSGVPEPYRSQTPNKLVQIPKDLKWRVDGRCGPNNPLPDGTAAQCNPDGYSPCCSYYGYCGSSDSHCTCYGCIDYRYSKRWRNDYRCGPYYPLFDGSPSECDPFGYYPCCFPEYGWCGNTAEYCYCPTCIDYRTMLF